MQNFQFNINFNLNILNKIKFYLIINLLVFYSEREFDHKR
jgi:hypothetical protein